MYRFLSTPRWIAFTALCAAAMAAMAYAGWGWQLRRVHEKNDLKDAIVAEVGKPPTAYRADLADWRSATVRGTYAQDGPIRVATNGGYFVYSPLALTDGGGTFLARRGFVSATADAATPPPADEVALTVRLRPIDADDELPLVSAGLDRNRILDVLASAPADASALQPLPAPKLPDSSNNISYVVQWTIFAICVAIGWVLAVRRTATVRRRAESGDSTPRRRRTTAAVPWRDDG